MRPIMNWALLYKKGQPENQHIAGIDLLFTDEERSLRMFKIKINANEAYYHLFQHGM